MPALPNVPKVIKTLLEFSNTDDTNQLVRLFLQYAGAAPTDAQLLTLATSIGGFIGTRLATFLSSNSTATGVTLEDLSSSTSASAALGVSVAGTRAGTPCTNATCVNIHNVIARRYRGGRPKNFWPFLVEGDRADVAHWNVTTLTNFTTAVSNFLSDINGAVWAGGTSLTLVNVSYYQGFTNFTYPSGRTRPRPTLRVTPVVDNVIELQATPRIGSQRRRMR